MLNFKTPLYFWQSKNSKKNSFPQESCFAYTHIKLYNFSMLINMSIAVLQVPDTLYLLATCTFSRYSTVDSVVTKLEVMKYVFTRITGGIINFMLQIQLQLLLFFSKTTLMRNRNWLDSEAVSC